MRLIHKICFLLHGIEFLLFFPSFLGILAFGVKESAIVSKIFTAVNILVLLFVVLSGIIKGNLSNWCITEDSLLQVHFSKTMFYKNIFSQYVR